MYKYAKVSKFILFIAWIFAFANMIFGFYENQGRVMVLFVIFGSILIMPLLIYKCENCGVDVFSSHFKDKWWQAEERLRVCPNCGENSTKKVHEQSFNTSKVRWRGFWILVFMNIVTIVMFHNVFK